MKLLITITTFVMSVSDTIAETPSTSVVDWINSIHSPGSALCPTEMRSTLNQCYVRNNSEAENIQPLCEHLIMKSSVSRKVSKKLLCGENEDSFRGMKKIFWCATSIQIQHFWRIKLLILNFARIVVGYSSYWEKKLSVQQEG